MIRALREAWAFFWHGHLCPRCGVERTGSWDVYVWDDDDSDEKWLCMTCYTVERIKYRDAWAKRLP